MGDSRAICSVGGTVEVLSNDHKPSNEHETNRIIAAGGWVEFNRVNGKYIVKSQYEDHRLKLQKWSQRVDIH